MILHPFAFNFLCNKAIDFSFPGIMREEKKFLMKNKDTKNNLYVKNIPKGKDPREIYEYFLKFGDVFSLKINENDKGDFTGTAFLTYYKEEDAKKCIEETTNKL